MLAFHHMFPEIGTDETRTVTVPSGGIAGIPEGEYGLVEFYCTDLKCDCRRVTIKVLRRDPPGQVATISHGFLPLDEHSKNMGQTYLDPINPQSRLAPLLMELFCEVALTPEYEERLQRHYRMVKEAMRDPRHPIHQRIAAASPGMSRRPPATVPPPRRPRKWKKPK